MKTCRRRVIHTALRTDRNDSEFIRKLKPYWSDTISFILQATTFRILARYPISTNSIRSDFDNYAIIVAPFVISHEIANRVAPA